MPRNASVRGSSLEAMHKYFPEDYWTPAMTEDLLIYSYGVLASTITQRSYFGCHRLPPAEKIVDDAFEKFTKVYKYGPIEDIEPKHGVPAAETA